MEETNAIKKHLLHFRFLHVFYSKKKQKIPNVYIIKGPLHHSKTTTNCFLPFLTMDHCSFSVTRFLSLATISCTILSLCEVREAAAFQKHHHQQQQHQRQQYHHQEQFGRPLCQLGTSRCNTATSTNNNNNNRYPSRLYVLNVEQQDSSSATPPEKEEEVATGNNNNDIDDNVKNKGLLRLAELSLEDYKWRSGKFKSDEADRKVEESLARMMGDEAAYVRPMDASESKIGPLGLLEKSSVDWVRNVIEEEARRAKSIVRLGGMMVRPIDAVTEDGELGPLGLLEKQFINFLDSIRSSEKERTRTMTLRPKDLDASNRGPLGEAELKAVEGIREILDSEKLRAEQSKLQDQIVRPIDVPGPIGEFEMKVLEVCEAERQRKEDRQESGAFLVRPKDASIQGPLGELEELAVQAVKKLTAEEKRRLQNIQRVLDENRPMEQDQLSVLGIFESIAVGIVRAPILLFQILKRVSDLMESEPLSKADAEVLARYEKIEKAKRNMKKKNK